MLIDIYVCKKIYEIMIEIVSSHNEDGNYRTNIEITLKIEIEITII